MLVWSLHFSSHCVAPTATLIILIMSKMKFVEIIGTMQKSLKLSLCLCFYDLLSNKVIDLSTNALLHLFKHCCELIA